MLQPNETSWVILAGGQASRMGGNDKGLILLNSEPLIAHVIKKLSLQVDKITINANRNIETYRQFAPVISDEFADYPGPLGGIHAGLSHAQTDWVGFVPCDSPMIADDLVRRFCNAVEAKTDIVVASDGQFHQPVFTLFHRRVLPKLTAFLERGERKIVCFYHECQTQFVDFSDNPNCFINLNTPEELANFGGQ
ncbi:molybdenum cofactor guanylyltransferase MobA [Vibrio sp. SM6]|uniref:Molybdenum cofactor guanylyltransferase n=1 Tax=Vibrio agarilyticus TaxID=2726741 RepID=A0A7X8TQA2_9VIBR|nr:molybdenum cofactor guanylyltransferase MobA [Vibrio agarilyticus]NLS12647.1 molybdenum cofactor guanylyltransferase MobA [Vibrio agarilyticus]